MGGDGQGQPGDQADGHHQHHEDERGDQALGELGRGQGGDDLVQPDVVGGKARDRRRLVEHQLEVAEEGIEGEDAEDGQRGQEEQVGQARLPEESGAPARSPGPGACPGQADRRHGHGPAPALRADGVEEVQGGRVGIDGDANRLAGRRVARPGAAGARSTATRPGWCR